MKKYKDVKKFVYKKKKKSFVAMLPAAKLIKIQTS